MNTTCNRCHRQPAREGCKSCATCGAQAARNMRKVRRLGGAAHRRKQIVWTRQSEARRRPVLIASGICVHCQCKPARPGMLWCQPCRDVSDKAQGKTIGS